MRAKDKKRLRALPGRDRQITVGMGEAKTRLSELVDRAAKGETFLIAKAGKAVVKLTAIDRSAQARLGFLAGEILAPEDFDRMGRAEIDSWFATKA